MAQEDKTKEELLEEIQKLRQENRNLKKLASNLSEAATKLSNRETSWIYALEGNRDGVWDWNMVTNEVFFSTRWKEMLGFEEKEISNDLSEWDKRVHPDDREAVYAGLNRHLEGKIPFYENEHRVRCKDGSYKWILDRGKVISWTEAGKPLRVVGTHTDVTLKKEAELEKERLLKKLTQALDRIKVLRGFIPICSVCKKIRNDKGYWEMIETYIRNHSDAEFSHGICPECARKMYPEFTDSTE